MSISQAIYTQCRPVCQTKCPPICIMLQFLKLDVHQMYHVQGSSYILLVIASHMLFVAEIYLIMVTKHYNKSGWIYFVNDDLMKGGLVM